MSAFMCNQSSVSAIAEYLAGYFNNHIVYGLGNNDRSAFRSCYDYDDHEYKPELIYKALRDLNMLALHERYGQKAKEMIGDDPGYEHTDTPSKCALLKKFHCFIYQCSEGAAERSSYYKAIVNASYRLAEDIAIDQPEYIEAIWG